MVERLRGLDAMYLYLESPSQPLNICCVVRLDLGSRRNAASFAAFRDDLIERLGRVPELRQRVADGRLNLGHPVWVEDNDFDAVRHLHRVGVASPGGREERAAILAHIASLPLDRRHPLWEVWLLENAATPDALEVVFKAHHAVVDGVGGVNIMAQLCTTAPGSSAPSVRAGAPSPSSLEIVASGFLGAARRPMQLSRVLPATVLTALGSLARARRGKVMAPPFAAPPTVFNGSYSRCRSVAFASMDLDVIKAVKRRHDVTVNDVVMAVCAGALRTFLAGRHDLPESPLIAAIPVSVQGMSDRPGRNQTSYMFCRLPTPVDGPVERLVAVTETVAAAKDHTSAVGPTLLHDWSDLLGQSAMSVIRRLAGTIPTPANPPFNLILSNVPGPQQPLYLADLEISSVTPLGPILINAGLNVTVMSYNGNLRVGLVSSPDLDADLWQLVDEFPRALAELAAAP
ncbi:wax ester/triacylglycerol synthase family O-acyltransferase [Mycolicibacterium sp. 3033]|nr:wax ester/triacylglycerol synthase family O-acyltransferase [Mycolicibacterium aurantiacum]